MLEDIWLIMRIYVLFIVLKSTKSIWIMRPWRWRVKTWAGTKQNHDMRDNLTRYLLTLNKFKGVTSCYKSRIDYYNYPEPKQRCLETNHGCCRHRNGHYISIGFFRLVCILLKFLCWISLDFKSLTGVD